MGNKYLCARHASSNKFNANDVPQSRSEKEASRQTRQAIQGREAKMISSLEHSQVILHAPYGTRQRLSCPSMLRSTFPMTSGTS